MSNVTEDRQDTDRKLITEGALSGPGADEEGRKPLGKEASANQERHSKVKKSKYKEKISGLID